ncbi:MAG TPA: ADP-ribosylglycohydrolase family protein [Treponemataceae bacterium]|nr:ADP-ribosylglycohydrolase family protein [Treponemataceae bacterium]
MNTYQKFLIGCALGDALGVPVEGKTNKFTPRYGQDLIKKLTFCKRVLYNFTGQVSDDTQLTILLAKNMIQNDGSNSESLMDTMAHAYAKNKIDGVGTSCRLAFENYLSNSFRYDNCGTPEGRSGNGAAIRVGLIGLYYDDEDTVIQKTVEVASLTHRDSKAIAGAVVISLMAHFLVTTNRKN